MKRIITKKNEEFIKNEELKKDIDIIKFENNTENREFRELELERIFNNLYKEFEIVF